MVKIEHALLGLAALAGGILLLKKSSEFRGPNSLPDSVSASASPYAPLENNAATAAALGVLNPYEGGPQTIKNPEAPNADYAPWGGTIEQGGYMFAFINGVNTRNPSADLVFVRGEGVYR